MEVHRIIDHFGLYCYAGSFYFISLNTIDNQKNKNKYSIVLSIILLIQFLKK